MKRTLVLLLALLSTGCTATLGGDGMDPQFHMPVTYHDWQVRQYKTPQGMDVCGITSGYNGITITLGQSASNPDVVVASARMMQPGATLTVTIGGRNFESYDTYFAPQVGRELVKAMTQSDQDKAYLEWSEFSGPSGRERVQVQNIVTLGGFKARLAECRKALGQ